MSTDKRYKVPCIGHIFKAVFIISLLAIVINLVHIIMAVRHKSYIHISAPFVSVVCYLCLIAAFTFWIHYFFYPEFFLNALALPIKTILAVLLLFNSIDILDINIEKTDIEGSYRSNEVTKDVVHTIRAVFILIGVILELYVFRLCQKAHLLMKTMKKEEGRKHFHVKRFLTAEDFIKDRQHEMEEQKTEKSTKD